MSQISSALKRLGARDIVFAVNDENMNMLTQANVA